MTIPNDYVARLWEVLDSYCDMTQINVAIKIYIPVHTFIHQDGSSLLHRLVVASRAWVKGGSGEVLAWLDEVEQAETARGGPGRRGEAARIGHGRKIETGRRGEIRVSEEMRKGHGSQTYIDRRGEVRQGGMAAAGERLRDDRSMSGSRAGQASSRTRVWVVAPGVRNLNHILLYHRQQVSHMLF